MSTTSTSSIDPTTLSQSTAAAGLSMNDLLKLMMTDLTYQDPLKPVDNKDFLTEMAQFTTLDTTRQLNTNIQALLTSQSLNQSVALIGKTVDATNNGATVSGTVTALHMVSGQAQITVTDSSGNVTSGLALSQIQTVR